MSLDVTDVFNDSKASPLCALSIVHTLQCAHSPVCALSIVRTFHCAHSIVRTLHCVHFPLCSLSIVRTLHCAHSTVRTFHCAHSIVRTLHCVHSPPCHCEVGPVVSGCGIASRLCLYCSRQVPSLAGAATSKIFVMTKLLS